VAVFGIVVALALPLDSFDLFERFARSDAAREQAMTLAQAIAVNDSAGGTAPQDIRLAFAKLQAVEIVVVPASRAEWVARWQKVNWAGVAAGALLLTLGAPFWFQLLKDLLKLRSAVARNRRIVRSGRPLWRCLPPPGPPESEGSYERNPESVFSREFYAGAARRIAAGGYCDSYLGRNA
jgi:hypothetical protein